MVEDNGEALGATGRRKVRLSLAEIHTMILLPLQVLSLCCFALTGINAPSPRLGLGTLLFILITSSYLILLLWKTGQREQPPYWLFKNVEFWLMAVAYVAVIGVLVLMAMFQIILPPSMLTSPFISDLLYIAMGLLLFMMVALVVWIVRANLLQARRDLRH